MSSDYWRRREEEALQNYLQDEEEYSRRVNQIYSDMYDACVADIEAFYGRYAAKEGITLAEARQRVSAVDIEEYERKAARYVRAASLDRAANGRTDRSAFYFSPQANEEMRLYNLTMKVNRLEMLKANLGLEMVKGHAELETFMEGILRGRAEDELRRQAGILGKTVRNNAKMVDAIARGSFHNATFSDRIWQYHDLMKADLSKLLQQGLIQGKNARAIAKDLEKYYFGKPEVDGGARYCAERLMRTELARVQTEAQKQSFKRNGFDYYEFIVNSGCCPICQGISGKHFKVDKMKPGENAPPMHPNCRCSTAAWEDNEEYEAWLDHLEQGGTTAEWNATKAARAINNYTSAKSYVINEALRTSRELSYEEEKMVDDLDVALSEMPKYQGNLQRSLLFYSKDDISLFMRGYTPGRIVTYDEYISTTKNDEPYNPAGQVQIHIANATRGRDISTYNPEEGEVLYERGASFVVRMIWEQDGQHHIFLEEYNE